MEKKKISLPIIVEGRYDKATLSSIFDCRVYTTSGFGVFNSAERVAVFRKISGEGVIVLTDSDGGGKQIRKFLASILPPDKIHNLFIPKIEGKESRKRKASKSGTLGVEGMEKDVLVRLLTPFANGEVSQRDGRVITKVDFFTDKLTGCGGASENRAKLCRECNLPEDMTPNALLEAMNLLYGYEEYKKIIENLL